jgi:hypothetical protein
MARNKYRSKFESDDEHSPLSKILTTCLVLAFVAGAGFAGWTLFERKKEGDGIDKETSCRISGDADVTAVLIDRTDGINATQAENLKTLIGEWAADVPKYGAFRVYYVKAGDGIPVPYLNICNPGDDGDASVWTSNKKKISKRYNDRFAGKVADLVAKMQSDEKADSSPIMEAVRDISSREFANKNVTGRFFVVSDLMQHTAEFSLYRKVPAVDAFRKSSYGRKVEGNLKGLATTIYLLRSSSDKQTDAVAEFWVEWLSLQGADIQGFLKVPG